MRLGNMSQKRLLKARHRNGKNVIFRVLEALEITLSVMEALVFVRISSHENVDSK